MVRPKKNAEGKSAQERLEDAFWAALAEAPYSDMTIMGVSKRAQVNHNTFYRYYDNLNDMAKKLFEGLMLEGLPEFLISAHLSKAMHEKTVSIQMNPDDLNKAFLFARSGSSYLAGILHDTVTSTWLSAVGVDKEKLTIEQQIDIDIIFGGLVTALGNPNISPSPSLLADIMERPLGKGIIATLATLAGKGESRESHA